MRTLSAAPDPAPSREAGFSLVELLAVLAIMSLMVGAVVVSLPAPDGPLERGSRLMVERLQAELDRAALAGEMRALRLDDDALTLIGDTGAGLEPLETFDWPDAARVTAEADGTRIDLRADTPPLFWIEPYGAVPDLDVSLRGPREGFVLSFDDRGRVIREATR